MNPTVRMLPVGLVALLVVGGALPAQQAQSADTTTRSAPRRDYSAPLGAPYTAEDVTVRTPMGHTLAGTLTLPVGANRSNRVPAVVTITGSGAQDRDETLSSPPGYRPFRQFADSLGRRGIAVLRMDDRGFGGSTGDHATATSADFARDIQAGLAYLRTRSEIDGGRLALLGHSEGGLIGPLVAVDEPELRALVLMAAPSWGGRRILEFQLGNLARGDTTLRGPGLDSVLGRIPFRIDSLRAANPWMSFFIDHDVLAVARRIGQPVLLLNGGTDLQVTEEQAEELASAIRAGGNRDVTVRVFPDLNHLFIYDPVGTPTGYSRLPRSAVEPVVIGTAVEWLVERLAAAQGAAPAGAMDQLDAYIAGAVRDWRVPGLAIAIVKDDSVVFAKGYGVRALGAPGAVDVSTRFAIGSTTKAMTAVALGMLVDEGKVRWDDPVVTHLPWFRVGDPYVTRELTVRDLLTHRGGLPNADHLWASADFTAEEITRRVATIDPAYSLRSRFVYQNVMYAVAGDVVAAASGMPWADFLRTRIFLPLGMTSTEATLAGVAGKPNVATPHMEIGGAVRTVTNRTVDPVAPAGSVWSSVGDMARWMRFVLDSGRAGGRRLLGEATFTELLSPQVIAPVGMYPTTTIVRPHFFTYGLGWFLHDYQGEAVAMHTGSIDGMSALIGLIPDRRLGVYVLANLDHAELRHALMYRVFDLYGGRAPRDWSAELLELYGGIRTRAAAAQRQQEARRVAGTRPSLSLDSYTGTYAHPTFGTVQVRARADGLELSFGRGRVGALSHWHYDTFQARWEDIRRSPSLVVFGPDGTGGVSTVRTLGITFTKELDE